MILVINKAIKGLKLGRMNHC